MSIESVAERESQVTRVVKDLALAIDETRASVRDLEKRLEPVIHAESPQVSGTAPKGPEALVPLSAALSNHLASIRQVNDIVRDIVKRLEL